MYLNSRGSHLLSVEEILKLEPIPYVKQVIRRCSMHSFVLNRRRHLCKNPSSMPRSGVGNHVCCSANDFRHRRRNYSNELPYVHEENQLLSSCSGCDETKKCQKRSEKCIAFEQTIRSLCKCKVWEICGKCRKFSFMENLFSLARSSRSIAVMFSVSYLRNDIFIVFVWWRYRRLLEAFCRYFAFQAERRITASRLYGDASHLPV